MHPSRTALEAKVHQPPASSAALTSQYPGFIVDLETPPANNMDDYRPLTSQYILDSSSIWKLLRPIIWMTLKNVNVVLHAPLESHCCFIIAFFLGCAYHFTQQNIEDILSYLN
jgi:hypothetical protein